MIKHTISLMRTIALAGIVLLPGCIKEFRYEAKQLPALNSYNAHYEHMSHGITVLTRTLDEQETRSLFNGHGKHLNNRRGYTPIMLSITNNTAHPFTITPQDIQIPQATARQINHAVHHNVAARIALIVVAGVIIAIPAVVVGGLTVAGGLAFLGTSIGTKIIATGSLAVGAGIATSVATTTTATMEGMRAKAQNICIEEDIARVSLLHEQSINPTKKITKLIFVPKQEFVKKFQLTLTNADNELDAIAFDINLAQKDQCNGSINHL